MGYLIASFVWHSSIGNVRSARNIPNVNPGSRMIGRHPLPCLAPLFAGLKLSAQMRMMS